MLALAAAVIALAGAGDAAESTHPDSQGSDKSLPIQEALARKAGWRITTGQMRPKIVNGIRVKPGEIPFQVALLLNPREGESDPRYDQFCGGSLIAPDTVLTAAHCVDRKTLPEDVLVFYGQVDLGQAGTVARVTKIVIHEEWKGNVQASNDADLAVLKIQPIAAVAFPALATRAEETAPGRSMTVSGWGLIKENGSPSAVLRKAGVAVTTDKDCRDAYGAGLTPNMFCAGGRDADGKITDSCQGDSGGPIFVLDRPEKTQLGIVSWGLGCAREHFPGVYTRIANYAAWIEGQKNTP